MKERASLSACGADVHIRLVLMVRPEWPYAAACARNLKDQSGGSGATGEGRRSSIWPKQKPSGKRRKS